MKNLRDKLEKIVKVLNCCEDKKCETCQMYTDKLLSLFKQQMKEMVGEMEKQSYKRIKNEGASIAVYTSIVRNTLRKELLKNIEEL